jgi:hypothetical protein
MHHRSRTLGRTALSFVALSLLAACSGSGKQPGGTPDVVPTAADTQAYSVSYTNQVRIPVDAQPLSAQGFANQTKALDPIAPFRCKPDESAAFRDVADYLGGVTWSHPVAILTDQSLPPLFTAKRKPVQFASVNGGAAADAPGAAPTIQRPDLVGLDNGIAVFLSKPHGLVAVDTNAGTLAPSCSLKLPGEPMNFLHHGNEIVVIVNAQNGMNRSALLRFSFDGAFHFVDAVRLDNQTITDARLFDSTIVAYTSWTRPRQAPTPPPDSAPPPATVPDYGFGGFGGGVAEGVSSGVGYPVFYGNSGDQLGTKVIVVQWDQSLGVDWQDSLLDDPAKQDPLEGTDPAKKYVAGDLVSEQKTYKGFVAASDRYLAVPRDVVRTKFQAYETVSYQVCTNYNPKFEQVEQCYVNYEQRPNPDYQPPDPKTGDYACNGKSLADCIQAAAPLVTQYIEVPVGQTCNMVWLGRCEQYQTQTDTYPTFTTERATEMTIYRFEGGSFTKLDSSLATLSTDPSKPDVLTFTKTPLAVNGAIDNRGQIQFQNGELYVFADGALQTLSVAGNSISYLGRLDVNENQNSDPAIVFSSNRAMISASNYYQSSNVAMIDLSTPPLPKLLQSFAMPGNTTQLILTSGGILGPGQVQTSYGNVTRSLEKLTLFSRDNGSELDNLLLGTEYDALASSWFDPNDDQRIRLSPSGTRLLLPYSGFHQADPTAPLTHRLNVTRIDTGRLVSEHSFDVGDDVVRTAPTDDEHALVFGNSATYWIDHTSGDWTLKALRELFTPFATYRFADNDLYAQIARLGSTCRITTHLGVPGVFDDAHLASADIPCDEGLPIAYQFDLVFQGTQTGVRISADGTRIDTLAGDAVKATLMAATADRGYCYVASGTGDAARIQFLDQVPADVLCEPTPKPQ